MKRLFILSLLFLGLMGLSTSCWNDELQEEHLESFLKFYGGAYKNVPTDIIQDGESFYLLYNHQEDEDNSTVYLQKVDKYGNTEHELAFSHSSGNIVTGNSLIKLQNGHIAIAGTAEVDEDSLFTDIYLLVVDPARFNSGASQSKVIDTIYNDQGYEEGLRIGQSETGLLVAGTQSKSGSSTYNRISRYIDSNYDIERSSSTGYQLASNTVGTLLNDGTTNFYLANQNTDFATVGAAIYYLDNYGAVNELYKSDFYGHFNDVKLLSNGELLVCGVINNGENGGADGYVALLEGVNSEQIIWEKEIGTSEDDESISVAVLKDNTIVLAGNIAGDNGKSNIYMLNLSMEGEILSEKQYGGADNDYSIKVFPDAKSNSFFIYGMSYYDETSSVLFIKTSF